MRLLIGAVCFVLAGTGLLLRPAPGRIALLLAVGLVAVHVLFYFLKARAREAWLALIVVVNLASQLTGGLAGPLIGINFLTGGLVLVRRHGIEMAGWMLASVISLSMASAVKGVFHLEPALGLLCFVAALYFVARQTRDEAAAAQSTLEYYEARSDYLTRRPAEPAAAVREGEQYSQIERPIAFFLKFLHQSLQAHSSGLFGFVEDGPQGGEMVLVRGISESRHFNNGARINYGEGFVGMIGQQKREILIKDFYERSGWLGYYSREVRIRSVMGAPVVFGKVLEGVIVIDRIDEPFTEEEREMLRVAAVTFAHLLGMLRSYEKKSYEASYFSALYELIKKLQRELTLEKILDVTLDSTLAALDCDTAGIASTNSLVNEGQVRAVRSEVKSPLVDKIGHDFALDEGLVGWVANLGGYLIKDDLKPGRTFRCFKSEGSGSCRSFLGVPIKDENRVIGVIWAESRLKSQFGEEDAEFMNFLAAQLSLAWIRADLYHQVKELAIRDGLTGLYNHRQFQELLRAALEKERELALLLIDVDHFKSINDRFGHPTGDEVLKSIARFLDEAGGSAARYGGEEFALILPGCNLKKAAEVAVKTRDRLKKQKFVCGGQEFTVTVSIGISHFPKDAKARGELIERADGALYDAKKQGRDRVILAGKVGVLSKPSI